MARSGDERLLGSNFWPRVEAGADEDCWRWIGAKGGKGYGQIRVAGSWWLAHRISWVLENGPIPDGLCVCHRCDNPLCVNPRHLFLGTRADNNADRDRKGRRVDPDRSGERNGRARLTHEAVAAIRERYVRGGTLQRTLAAEFGVSRRMISDIVTETRWTR